MALYNPNRPPEFRRIFPPVKKMTGKLNPDGTPEEVIEWEPSEPLEIWGPGVIDGDDDMEIRSASDVVHALPTGGTDEVLDPAKLQHMLLHRWGARAKWNLAEEVDTGQTDSENHPIKEIRALELNSKNLNTVLHPFHRKWLQLELARNFYPELFGSADPNSSKNGKSGTSGRKDGSTSGSNKKGTSQAQHSPNPVS